MRLSLTCTYQQRRSCMPVACRVPQRLKLWCVWHYMQIRQSNKTTTPHYTYVTSLFYCAQQYLLRAQDFNHLQWESCHMTPHDDIHYSLHTPYWNSWWKKIKNRPVAFEALFISLSLLMPFLSTFLPPLPSVPLWNVSPTLWWCMDATMARNSWLSGSWNTRLRLSTSSLMRYRHVHWRC